MTKPIITVDHIAKSYMIGRQREDQSFRAAVTDLVTGPFNRLVSLASGGSGTHPDREETFWALKDISFQVQPGEVVGIVGGNGAGKSTLLKVLSRITEPTLGEIRLRGRVASLLEVGTGFHPDLTGIENIYLNGAILGMRKQEIAGKLDQIIAFAEIEKFINTPVKRYSSGMYVRLAFAVAAHLEPEILIVDEVLAVGDIEFQKKCLGRMQQISQGEGRTVLFVSHNMGAVSSLCTKCIMLEKGTLVFDGGVQEGVARYLQKNITSDHLEQPLLGEGFDLLALKIAGPGDTRPTTFEPCTIDLDFRVHRPCSVAVHFTILSSTGQLVIGVDSLDLVPNMRGTEGGISRCSLKIASLPLIPGIYQLQLLFRNDTDYRSWSAPKSFEFTVDGVSVYGHRKVEARYHGTTAVEAEVAFIETSAGLADSTR